MRKKKLRRSILSSIVAVAMVGSLSFAPALASAKQDSQGLATGSISDGIPEWAIDDGNPQEGGLSAQAALPAAYDLRDEGLVTPVKFQNPWGSCWAFGGTSAAEVSILSASGKKYGEDDADHMKLDLSERHLTYFALSPVTNSVDPNQVGEGLHTFEPSAWEQEANPYAVQDAAFDAGGLPVYLTTLFAQGVGPVVESAFPYRGASGTSTYDDYSANDAHLVADILAILAAREGKTYDELMTILSKRAADEGKTIDEVIVEVVPNINTIKETVKNNSSEKTGTGSYTKYDDWSIPETNAQGHPNRLLSSGYVLKNGNVLPEYWNADKTERQVEGYTAIKQELLNGHGVNIAFHADQNGVYTMSDEGESNSYNQCVDDPTKRPNHGVCIVGWDDNYSKDNFNPNHRPDNDGAWIVKNSWGSTKDAAADDLGHVMGNKKYGMKDESGEFTGCFYLSYYDKSIQQLETMEFTQNLGSEGIFAALQHDYQPASQGFYATPTTDKVMSSANVFSTEDTPIVLKSVSTRTAETNMRVTFAIYELNDNAKDPADGKMLYRTSQNFEYGGFHRLDLDQPIKFGKGKKFSIVSTASVVDPSGKKRTYSTSASRGLTKDLAEALTKAGNKQKSYSQAVINAGESYLYQNGAWQDWKDYVAALPADPDPDIKTFMPSAKHYTDTWTVDNFSIKAYVEPAASTLVEVKAVAATCTNPGCIQYWYDTETGKYYKDAEGKTEISQSDTVVAALDHKWDKGKVTKKANAYTEGVRTYTCKRCGETKTEAIPATVVKGKSYKVSGSTYKVTSNTAKKRTVILMKAKAVKDDQKFTVPAKVKIKGSYYKVTDIKAKALNGSKAASIVVGSNVTAIHKYDLYGAKKAKTVTLGKNVGLISAKAFTTNASLRTLVLKTTKLAKAENVKNCLKGSKVTKLKVKVGTAAQNKKYVKKYKKLFSVKNPASGKRVTVV